MAATCLAAALLSPALVPAETIEPGEPVAPATRPAAGRTVDVAPQPHAAATDSRAASAPTSHRATGSAPTSHPALPLTDTGSLPRHILKRFDFDERKLGNYEDLPMYWNRRRGANLPHYNPGILDEQVGHGAPPSFRLSAITESVAFMYGRNDIPVEPGNRYLISGWIRSEGLDKARAYLSAAYMTRDLQLLDQTEVHTDPVGAEAGGGWTRVELATIEAPLQARFLQITAWIAQPEIQPDRHDDYRPIRLQDTNVTAWFDDIEVTHLLPVASIRTAADVPVFAQGEPARILGPRVNPAHFGLACRIGLTDEDGRSYYQNRTDPLEPEVAPPAVIDLPDLPCGLYTTSLEVFSQNRQVGQQQVRFVKLPGIERSTNNRIGICLDQESLQAVEASMACIRGLQTGCVKLPIWTRQTTGQQISDRQEAYRDLLKRMLAEGVEPIGVLAGPPAGVATHLMPKRYGLVDLLLADRQAWQPYLAVSLTHYADVVRLWQVGVDGQIETALDPRYAPAADIAAEQITTLIDGAEVALAWPAILAREKPAPHMARQSLTVPASIRPEQIAGFVEQQAQGGRPLWLTIEPIDHARYTAAVRRTDLCRRLISALTTNAATVFVPQPWQAIKAGPRTILAPTIEFPVVATLSRALAGRRYAGRFTWPGGAVFHVFAGSRDATLVAWNEQPQEVGAPPEAVDLYLGEDVRAFDLRGRPIVITGDTTQRVPVGIEPIVIMGADFRLAELRGLFRMVPHLVPSGLREHEQTLTLTNTYAEPVNGSIRIRGPGGWRISPSRLPFSLQPGQTFERTVRIQVPYNEPIGPKTLYADVTIDARQVYSLTIPIPLDLQLPGVETYAFSDHDGSSVIIRHVLTNRTDAQVNFVGSILLPAAARVERLFLHVRPGQTVVKEYIFPHKDLDGQQRVRLSLREINGSRFLNQMVEILGD